MENSFAKRNGEKVRKSVVKLFVQMSTPNYCMPWQMKRQQQCSGSGFVISERRILTNAHVIAYQKSVSSRKLMKILLDNLFLHEFYTEIRIRKHGDAKKYNAHILHVAHECDVAMVGVEDDDFWEDLEPLEMGGIPLLEEDVVVVGFPTGGDNISVTRGVVSRVDIQRYSHSGSQLLAIQIDAAINSGNSGGPAVREDRVVGIAFETLNNAENIGYIIPMPVINHFLEDIAKNNRFSGFCNLGIRWQAIESEHMRTYFQLEPKESGILVSKILRMSCCYNQLQRGDVLMSLGGVNIADDGSVEFRDSERILWNYLIHKRFPGDTVKAVVYRAGKRLGIDITLDIMSQLVPPHLYDKKPSYVVYCGLVFVALSQPYMLHQYGKDWGKKAPIRLCDRILYGVQGKKEQQVIVLSQVLASELTAGYDSFSNLQLYRVNGIPILNLRHLCHVLDKFTIPHVKRSCSIYNRNCTESPEDNYNDDMPGNENTTRKSATIGQSTVQPNSIYGVIDVSNSPAANENLGMVPLLAEREKDSYTSFNKIRGSYKDVCKESRNSDNGTGHQTICPLDVVCGLDNDNLSPEDLLYSEFTDQMDNLYHGAGDDPLLLDCTNFIHFELDKDKVAVFNISSAYVRSSEILEQYAISHCRSSELPKQQY